LHAVKTAAITPIGHAGHARLVAVQAQVHPLGDRVECGTSRLGAAAASRDGSLGIAGHGRTKLRRVASAMPQVIEEVQGDRAVHRGERCALGRRYTHRRTWVV
jgi:hypothetical protein